MKVKMLRTVQGSPDGIHDFPYVEGEVYTPKTEPPMSASLRDVLLRGGLAQDVGEAKVAPDTRETKVVNPAKERATEEDEEPTRVDVSLMRIDEVLSAVQRGAISAQAALAQERNGKSRSTLIEQLQSLESMREG